MRKKWASPVRQCPDGSWIQPILKWKRQLNCVPFLVVHWTTFFGKTCHFVIRPIPASGWKRCVRFTTYSIRSSAASRKRTQRLLSTEKQPHMESLYPRSSDGTFLLCHNSSRMCSICTGIQRPGYCQMVPHQLSGMRSCFSSRNKGMQLSRYAIHFAHRLRSFQTAIRR